MQVGSHQKAASLGLLRVVLRAPNRTRVVATYAFTDLT
jgi:hypothetical protein